MMSKEGYEMKWECILTKCRCKEHGYQSPHTHKSVECACCGELTSQDPESWNLCRNCYTCKPVFQHVEDFKNGS